MICATVRPQYTIYISFSSIGMLDDDLNKNVLFSSASFQESLADPLKHLITVLCLNLPLLRFAANSLQVCAFRERRALAFSLNDTKTAVNKLQQMLDIFVGIIIVIVWLLILKVASIQFFVFLSSQLLLVAFVFGNTCKAMFEGIVFFICDAPF